jgi:predicted enzyme related to lactoylglutathione lyase
MTSPFVWHELLTSDAAGAIAFYTNLFGWTEEGGALVVNGARALGVRKGPAHRAPHWAPFIRVEDVEAAVRAGVAAGGRVAGDPSAPPGKVLVDARGVATVVTAHRGDDGFAWHILESTDVAASRAWLAAIVGFTSPPEGGLWRDGEQVASLTASAHDRWLCHVVVEDRRAVRARAMELGGSVESADVDASGHGSYDVLLDPQGAPFCAFQAP